MENTSPIHIQEIIYGSPYAVISSRISKWEADGIIQKLASRIYTTNLENTTNDIIQRNPPILGNLYTDTVLSHRSAFELSPTASNPLFKTYIYKKN